MAQAARSYDPQPQPRLSSDEQRIADAVVAAIKPDLQSIDKRLGVLEQEMRGVNQIFALNGFILPDHDD